MLDEPQRQSEPRTAIASRRQRMPLYVTAAMILFASITVAAFAYAALFPPSFNTTHLLSRLQPPTLGLDGAGLHLLGTDQIGRDIFLRCLKGAQISISVAVAGVIGGCLIGTLVGLVSGYFGGWVDRCLMVVVDAQLAIPNLLIILCGITILGSNIVVLVVMIAVARWEGYARLVRGMVLSAREQDYVEAVRAVGGGPARILTLHILPNIASPLLVAITLSFPAIMLTEASLSFLGIGVQPPTPSLGRMVSEGRDHLATAPWISLGPSALLVVITLSAQIVGDWLRDRLDIKGTS